MTQSGVALVSRWEGLQGWLSRQGAAAAFITPGANLTYLTGWHTHSYERLTGLLLPSEGSPALIVPSLDAEAASRSPVREIYRWADGTDPYALVAEIARQKGLVNGVWALEKKVITLLQAERLAAAAGKAGALDAGEELAAMRVIKSPAEVASLQRAADCLNPALDAVKTFVRPGVTERQIIAVLLEALETAGSEGQSFPAIVLSGPNAALPHGTPGQRVVQEGDLVLADFGGLHGCYCSDITRTFVVGGWSEQARTMYDLVLTARDAAIAAVKPGLPCGEVDRAARSVIEKAGFSKYFIHRTGHGLGLDVHEEPWIVGGNPEPLRPGMVLTVEPGIYIPGWGGVRIEEMVLVTEDGGHCLTSYPADQAAMTIR